MTANVAISFPSTAQICVTAVAEGAAASCAVWVEIACLYTKIKFGAASILAASTETLIIRSTLVSNYFTALVANVS